MSKKSKILLCVIGIFLVTSILIGISYAYYIFNVSQSGSNVVRTDCFEITYTDGNAINLSETIPLSDKEARELDPYTFTIKNICNQAVDYNVNIETLEGSTMDLDAVATKLDGKKKQILGQLENNSNLVNSNATSSKTIYSNILRAGEEKTHNLRLWVDEDATLEQSMSKSYSSKVVVNGVLHPNYKEATLISGLEFNIALKKLSGQVPTQEEIDSFNSSLEGMTDICSDQSNKVDNEVACEWFNKYNNNPDFIYTTLENELINKIIFTNNLPESIETIKLSTNDSKTDVITWFDDGAIYIYSESNKIYLDEDSYGMFNGMSGLTKLDVSNFDTSNVTNMYGMFYETNSLTNLDVSNFDTSKVTNMGGMFEGMRSLTNLDVSNFDTSNVTDMRGMFSGMISLTNLDVSNFNTSNVTNMDSMFSDMSSLTNLDVSNFDTSNVTNMYDMFSRMRSLTNLDVSDFDTSSVVNMYSMFEGMRSLTNLDVSNFNTSNVTDMGWMFSDMSSLTNLDVSNFNTSNVTDMRGMFYKMSSLTNLDVSNFNTSNVTNMYSMFSDMSSVNKIYVGNSWSIESVASSSSMFSRDTKLVGGAGTAYDSSHIDKEYARVDDPTNGKPGYFTLKTS